MIKEIKIKSFNGIGDLLFVTPALRVIKEAHPDCRITVKTNYPGLLQGNPFIDEILGQWPTRPYDTDEDGVFLGYPDPKHRKIPTEHHIISDWKLLCRYYDLETGIPQLQPEIHFDLPERGEKVRVQVSQKDNWHGKKSWPYFREFCDQYGFEPIPRMSDIQGLVWLIAESRAVVCIEGGVSHIAKAVGTPAVVIFGGFAQPYWSGYKDQVNIVNQKPCSFCYNPDPCTHGHKCMMEITPDTVFQKLDGII